MRLRDLGWADCDYSLTFLRSHVYCALTLAQPTAIRRALAEANLTLVDIDGIAFTQGPGCVARRRRTWIAALT